MPCVQRRRGEEEAEYIRKNRKEIDPYAGITDVVEILRILHTPQPYDPLVVLRPPPKSAEELYSQLNSEQADRLMKVAADAMRAQKKDLAEDIGKSLAVLTDHSLDLMLESWIARNHFWPSVVFRSAGPKIRDAMVSALMTGKANANHALSALAWVGDEKVQELFRLWENDPPSWRSGLYVGPARYAHVAGWELSSQGKRDLFHKECLGITPVAESSIADASVRFMQEANQNCPWCTRPLVNLIELDLSDGRFAFLGFSGRNLPILTCDACTCFGTEFMHARISADGVARLAAENKRPDWLPEDSKTWEQSPWKDQRVRMHPRRAIHAVDWCMSDSISQIGGLPSWVQDTAFPKCPDCSTTMKFVGQVDNGQFPYHEGVYYAFLCASCRVTATTYQQT